MPRLGPIDLLRVEHEEWALEDGQDRNLGLHCAPHEKTRAALECVDIVGHRNPRSLATLNCFVLAPRIRIVNIDKKHS